MWFFLSLLIWIGGFGWLSHKYKNTIADWAIRHSRLPRYITYFLLASSLIIIEELLTCQPILSSQCLPTTFPAFQVMLAGLYIIWILTHLPARWAVWVFGIFGAYNEMILTGKQAMLQQNYPDQPHLVPLFWLLVIPTYMIIASVPMTYVEKHSRAGH